MWTLISRCAQEDALRATEMWKVTIMTRVMVHSVGVHIALKEVYCTAAQHWSGSKHEPSFVTTHTRDRCNAPWRRWDRKVSGAAHWEADDTVTPQLRYNVPWRRLRSMPDNSRCNAPSTPTMISVWETYRTDRSGEVKALRCGNWRGMRDSN